MMTNKDNKNDNIEDLMKSATEKADNDNFSEPKQEENNSTKKVVLSTIAGLVLFGGMLTGGAFMFKGTTDFEDKTEEPSWVGEEKEEEPEEIEYKFPIEFYEWAETPYEPEEFWLREGIEEEIIKSSREDVISFFQSIAWMKSGIESTSGLEGADGPYTNDIEQRYLEDDEDNPEFSYTLVEDYERAYMTYMERLMNPMFGGWNAAQYEDDMKSSFNFYRFKDMFAKDWWENNVSEGDDYSNLPIFTEWNNGDWDTYNLLKDDEFAGVFYGKISEDDERDIIVENVGIDEEEQTIIEVSSPVTYFAYDVDENIVEVKGTIDLTLESNDEQLEKEKRVIISDAKLTIND